MPYDRGLEGHSDGDCVLHALCDALLGAAAAGDMGRHFPSSDARWKGVASLALPRARSRASSRERGYAIENVDATVVAQAPRAGAATSRPCARSLEPLRSAVGARGRLGQGQEHRRPGRARPRRGHRRPGRGAAHARLMWACASHAVVVKCGMNLICGINPVLEALGAGTRHFDRLLVVKGLRNRRVSEAIARASQIGVPLRFEARETLDRMAGGVPHQGLIAVVSAKPVIGPRGAAGRGPRARRSSWCSTASRTRATWARSCAASEAAGADGVLLPERHSAGLSETREPRPRRARSSTCSVARIGNVVQALEALKARGFWVVGFDAAGTERWDAVDYRRPDRPRARRRGPRDPAPGARALRPPRVAAALRPRRLAQRVGGGGHRALRGGAPARRVPEPRAPDSRPNQAHRAIVGPASDDAEDDPGRIGPRRAARDGEDPAESVAPLFRRARRRGGGGLGRDRPC